MDKLGTYSSDICKKIYHYVLDLKTFGFFDLNHEVIERFETEFNWGICKSNYCLDNIMATRLYKNDCFICHVIRMDPKRNIIKTLSRMPERYNELIMMYYGYFYQHCRKLLWINSKMQGHYGNKHSIKIGIAKIKKNKLYYLTMDHYGYRVLPSTVKVLLDDREPFPVAIRYDIFEGTLFYIGELEYDPMNIHQITIIKKNVDEYLNKTNTRIYRQDAIPRRCVNLISYFYIQLEPNMREYLKQVVL